MVELIYLVLPWIITFLFFLGGLLCIYKGAGDLYNAVMGKTKRFESVFIIAGGAAGVSIGGTFFFILTVLN